MTVQIGKAKRRPSARRIAAVEAALGAALPDDYKAFLARHDGARPEPNIFRISDTNSAGVNGFIPAAELLKERALLADELLPGAVPIAWAEGGNYVVLEPGRGGAVSFWDHEEPEGLTPLAESFSAFLELLQPFDASSVELKPGQVQSAWIDPDFLKSLGQ